jgi:hypothetical protein
LFYLESGDYLDDDGTTTDEETTDTTDMAVNTMTNTLMVSLHALVGI